MDDDKFAAWCAWAKTSFRQFVLRKPRALDFVASDCGLGDKGCVAMVELLKALQIPVFGLKLYSNRIGDQGAASLAEFILENAVHELHLSHNQITFQGARKLLQSLAIAVDSSGDPLYPIHESNQRPKPMWLRLENNMIEVGNQSLFALAEEEIRRARENRGFLEPGKPIPLLCEVPTGLCNSKNCSKLATGARGRFMGPVAQVPWIQKQKCSRYDGMPPRRFESLPSPGRTIPEVTPPSRPIQTVLPPSRPIPAVAPPSQTTPTVMPPRCRDIRLDKPTMTAGLEQRSIIRPKEGQRARVLKAVGGQPGEWDAENFLINLVAHTEVDVRYAGTAAAGDEGWCWAITCTDGKQGWLSLENLETLPALDLMG